jgi:hypothetical protein
VNGFDPAPFVPQEKGTIAWREKGSGELRIPHRLYEFAHRVTSTRNELLVFDCLLRFSLGFHRSWCEAGYSFIAAWTGISDITNIKKSLRTLLAAGIVVKTKEHDSASNSGSIYELPVVKGYLEYIANTREQQPAKQPVGFAPSGHATPGDVKSPAGGRKTSGPLGVLPPKKENLNQSSKKSLSQENLEIDAYVDGIKPAAKRESEMHFLGKLLSEYPMQEVLLALNYVRRFGALGSKQECHSPLKYLSAAIEQVLPRAREWTALLCRTENVESGSEVVNDDIPSADSKLRVRALEAFQSQLPQGEQDRLLAEATTENSVMGYAPPINVLRSIAAMKWFDAPEKSERDKAGKGRSQNEREV